MKKRNLLFLSFVLLATTLFGQGQDKIWVMGYDCCNPPFTGMNLNFNSGTLSISAETRYMDFEETNGEICDAQGNLLFYTNGIYIANSLDDTMQNGAGLNPSPFTTFWSSHGLIIPQANIVIPFPNDSSKYYLFHETCDDWGQTNTSLNLYYSVIDMSLNGGLGSVIQKNISLLSDSLVEGRIAACKHANGRDWWLLVPRYLDGDFYEFLITPQGILGPWIKSLITQRDVSFGQAVFSPQGNKFAYYEPQNDLDIWDFDRCNGNFANQVHIDINDSATTAGTAFSRSGRYLYVSSTFYLYQFDLQASNIDSSKVIVGVFDGYASYSLPTVFYLSALAPDGKIYINSGNSSTEMHVINYPDSAGLSCNFCQHCVFLPGANAFTMPNHPNYFLGAEGGTICDSLPTGISAIRKPIDEYSIFPNPANVDLYVNLGAEKLKSFSVFNSLGQQVVVGGDVIKGEYLHLNLDRLENGFYYLEMMTEGEKVVRRFVKE